MANSKALATLLIGDSYRRGWEAHYRQSWEDYGRRHGYDVVAIGDWIDPTPRSRARSPHWQKCLILDHPDLAGYEHVVWVDADVLINANRSPCIVSAHDSDRIGALSYNALNRSDSRRRAAREDRAVQLFADLSGETPERTAVAAVDRYVRAGLPGDVEDWTNTGVLVLQPRHRDLLRHVYDTGVESEHSLFDNMALSYHIFASGEFAAIDPRFNVDLYYELLESYPFLLFADYGRSLLLRTLAINTIFLNSFFLHFVGGVGPSLRSDVQLVARNLPDPRDLYPRLADFLRQNGALDQP
jgi:hypothetical protein